MHLFSYIKTVGNSMLTYRKEMREFLLIITDNHDIPFINVDNFLKQKNKARLKPGFIKQSSYY